jgi:hypothetical protein
MKITITTPFANKLYCLDRFLKSMEDVIWATYFDADMHYIIYDNCNDTHTTDKILDWANTLPISFEHYEDYTEHITIENTSDYGRVSGRCVEIYKKIFEDLVDPCTDLVFNTEDDTTFPSWALKRLIMHLKENPDVVTASGVSYNRRLGNLKAGLPMIWDFNGKTRVLLPEMSKGTRIIGATGLGCWLTRYPVLREMGWCVEDGVGGGDICWGYRLKKYNKGKYLVDDSLQCPHWWIDKETGTVGAYTYGMTQSDIDEFKWDGVVRKTGSATFRMVGDKRVQLTK